MSEVIHAYLSGVAEQWDRNTGDNWPALSVDLHKVPEYVDSRGRPRMSGKPVSQLCSTCLKEVTASLWKLGLHRIQDFAKLRVQPENLAHDHSNLVRRGFVWFMLPHHTLHQGKS